MGPQIKPIPKIVGLFAWLLRRNTDNYQISIAQPYIAFPFSYSALPNGHLANATLVNMNTAIGAIKGHLAHSASILYSGCEHPFNGAAELEIEAKRMLCYERGVRGTSIGPISNTIQEVMAMKAFFDKEGFDPKAVLLITCELHAASVLLLARHYMPEIEFVIISNSYRYEVQDDHPTPDQRSWSRWLWCSVLRYAVIRTVCWIPVRSWRDAIFLRLSKVKHGSGRL